MIDEALIVKFSSVLVLGYIIGSIPFSVLIGKLMRDINDLYQYRDNITCQRAGTEHRLGDKLNL